MPTASAADASDNSDMLNCFLRPFGSYRPDVDGLRAIAVLSIIVFHINRELLPGGFVGVDIFFVISGFLITRNILQDLESGRFSILEFYRRRVKRIAPVMLCVVLLTMLAAQFLFLPEDAEKTAESSLWSLLSMANVYFWLHQDTSYFAADSSEIPLLHLWSLGVEEQFYIIWPLLLLLAFRPRHIKLFFVSTLLIALLSFVLGEILFGISPSFVYYMLPTRAGELLMGALVAIVILRGVERVLPANIIGPMALVGFVLLTSSLFLLSEDEVFPGLRALPPTLGAFLLILAGHCRDNAISRLLTFRPLVWIGLISYSAYLWHWPLLAFYRYGYLEVSAAVGTGIFGLTLLLAWLSYRYVEQPARRSTASVSRVILYQYVAPASALIVIALGAMYLDGYGIRSIYGEYEYHLADIRDANTYAYSAEYVSQNYLLSEKDAKDERYVLGADESDPIDVILWGDSNAAHFIGMLGVFARESGFSFRNLAHSSCPPVDVDPSPYVGATMVSDCRQSLNVARSAVDDYQVVIISASWSDYQLNDTGFLPAFIDTARTLAQKGKLVILIGKLPEISGYDRRCREKALSYPFLSCAVTAPISVSSNIMMANTVLREFAQQTDNVDYFDVTPYVCSDGLCSALGSTGSSLYVDPYHLALAGSWDLGEDILQRDGVPAPFASIKDFQRLAHTSH